MKKIYTLFTLGFLFNFNSQAQLTLTKAVNEPIIGDVNVTKHFDTVTVFPKNIGSGQSWNFSNMVANTNTETVTYTTVASSPSPALFSNANIALSRGTDWDLMKSNPSTYEIAGMIQGTNDVVVFSNTGVIYNWPISYSNSNADLFVATETTGTDVVNWSGGVTTTADGSGTVTMPGGGVYNNCLKLTRNITFTMSGATSTTQVFLINYEYWSSAFKFPIVTGEYETSITGTVVTHKSPSFWLNTLALPVGLKENSNSVPDMIIYPNPANTEVNISFSKEVSDVQVEVTDLAGKVLIKAENAGKLNVAGLDAGLYIISLKNNNFITRRSLIISR